MTSFRWWGINNKGLLEGDSTKLIKFDDWARSRFIDLSQPHGERPVPSTIESSFKCSLTYVPQEAVDRIDELDVIPGG